MQDTTETKGTCNSKSCPSLVLSAEHNTSLKGLLRAEEKHLLLCVHYRTWCRLRGHPPNVLSNNKHKPYFSERLDLVFAHGTRLGLSCSDNITHLFPGLRNKREAPLLTCYLGFSADISALSKMSFNNMLNVKKMRHFSFRGCFCVQIPIIQHQRDRGNLQMSQWQWQRQVCQHDNVAFNISLRVSRAHSVEMQSIEGTLECELDKALM